MSSERSRLLSSPIVAQAKAAGLSEAEIVGLAQAYTRGIARMVSAEIHLMARKMEGLPTVELGEWARRWLGELTPLSGPAFAELHTAQLDTAVEKLLAAPGGAHPAELAVSFVDLCGSTDFMSVASRDDIRGLVDDVFLAAREVANRHDVRVSKHLGDGVLLVGPSRAEMVLAVTDLADELERRTPLSAAAGIEFGTVTTRAGDHFGLPVNLAARLSEVAEAREVLVGAAAVPDPAPVGVWATQSVRGVAEPQRILRLFRPLDRG